MKLRELRDNVGVVACLDPQAMGRHKTNGLTQGQHPTKTKRAGFTLMELLAVIVILAALATIAVPIFTNKSDTAKQVAHNENIRLLQKQGQAYLLEQSTLPVPGTDILDSMVTSGKIKEKPINPLTNAQDYKVIMNTDKTVSVIVPANPPKLVAGMTPVKWVGAAGSGVETPTTEADVAWYKYNGDIASTVGGTQYTADKWANAKLAEGSLFVWIPRYTYKITEAVAGQIQIKYSNGTTDDTLDRFKVHPAFNFGGVQLTGIWVGKFEASGTTITVGTGTNAATRYSGSIKVRPGVSSWRGITVDAIYTACRAMQNAGNPYGISTDASQIDTHLMKNSEWAAAAYLAEAIRDRNEVWINNSGNYITGSAGNSVSAGMNVGTTNNYKSVQGMQASTTGNEYGVYDMSGGAYEYVASYVANGKSELTTYGNSLLLAPAKYKDAINVIEDADPTEQENYDYVKNILGEEIVSGLALHEVTQAGTEYSNFQGYNDYQFFAYNSYPFFNRGGCNSYGTYAGVFEYDYMHGNGIDPASFRPVLVGMK